jgi:glycerate kinase
VDALGGELVRTSVHGPLNDPVEASFGLAETAEGRLAIVEMAAASGLALLALSRRGPRITTTRGAGDQIAASLDRSPDQLVVALGGSATNDGGAGMAQALGVKLLDGSGRDIGSGGVALLELERIDMTGRDPRIERVGCVAATDVNNPLTGPLGASAAYGPQKGASAQDVGVLDHALGHLAAIVQRDLGVDLRDEPGAGAAGGLGFGLMAFLGARVRPGVEVVSEALDLTSRLSDADLVITGEGRLDAGSLHGKVPAGIIRLARELSVPAVIACGQAEPGLGPTGATVVSMADRFGVQMALSDARRCLVKLTEELARRADALVQGAR